MRKQCQNRQENERDCPCGETDCERHGICCECIRYHLKTRSKPACFSKLS